MCRHPFHSAAAWEAEWSAGRTDGSARNPSRSPVPFMGASRSCYNWPALGPLGRATVHTSYWSGIHPKICLNCPASPSNELGPRGTATSTATTQGPRWGQALSSPSLPRGSKDQALCTGTKGQGRKPPTLLFQGQQPTGPEVLVPGYASESPSELSKIPRPGPCPKMDVLGLRRGPGSSVS